MQEVRYNILVEKAISFTFTIYIVQSSYNYKIPPSVITGLNDTHLSFNVFWKDKLTFFWKNICGGPPEMMVLFSRTSLISLPSFVSMHHFRSRTIKYERDYLVNYWENA